MEAARGDGLHTIGQTGHRDGYETVGRGVVAELAGRVVAPALDPTVHQGTRVRAVGGDGLHARRQADDWSGYWGIGRRVVAELTTEIVSPALDATIDQHAGVIGAR